MKRFLAILLSISVSGAPVISSAASTGLPAGSSATTQKQWAALLGPNSLAAAVSECIDTVKTSDKTISVTLTNGVRVDTVKQADGKAKTINTFDSKGVLVRSVEVAAVAHPDKAPVATYVARDAGYQAMKRLAKDAFLTSLRNKCHGMAVKKAASVASKGSAQPDLVNTPGCGGWSDVGEEDGGSPYDQCISEGGGGGGQGGGAVEDDTDYAFYGDMAGDMISDDMSMAQAALGVNPTTAPMMKCTVAVSQCRDSCTSWGNWAIGACVAAAAAIGRWNAGAGVLAGITCTWDATAWTEGCKQDCNTPTVQCTP